MNLSPNDVHLWLVHSEKITDDHLLEQYNALLNEEEKTKKNNFHFKKHRHQYLISRIVVRSVLSLYVTEIQPKDWRFSTNKFGKPFISNPHLPIPLQFNLAHSDDMIVLAVSHSLIGVDIENRHRENINILGIAESHFTSDEFISLKNRSTQDQRACFFYSWTLKEAYIKARGIGLSMPLNQFAFMFSDENKELIEFIADRDEQAENWQFWQLRPHDSYIVSLAAKLNSPKQRLLISMQEIMPFFTVDKVNYPIIRYSKL